MTTVKAARQALAGLFVAVLLPTVTAQTVTIAVNRGNGAEYQVGEAITITYAVSVDAAIEVFDVSPAGVSSLIDRRQARANQEYALTGVIEPPLGVVVFEVKATTTAGQALTASAFIRIVAGEEPWAWLSSADISGARLLSKRVVYEVEEDGRSIFSIHSAPQGGLLIHEGYVNPRGSCSSERQMHVSAVHLLAHGKPSVELFRGALAIVVAAQAPNSVFFVPAFSGISAMHAPVGIDEFDLVSGMTRTISDFHDSFAQSCNPMRLTAISHPYSDDHVVVASQSLTSFPRQATRIYGIRTSAYANAEELGLIEPGVWTMAWSRSSAQVGDDLFVCLSSSSCVVLDLFGGSDSFGFTRRVTADHLGLSHAIMLAASPVGDAHLVIDRRMGLWVMRLGSGERANIANGLEPVWLADGYGTPGNGIAWDLRREVTYWVDGNRVYEGVLSIPSARER